ncbi:exosortase A [Rheinheimera fenheensis]|uniref:exosortase A n=1 Tax=Rheinheimera fenheensis TaxID=3152295 RepID=UPI003261CF6A
MTVGMQRTLWLATMALLLVIYSLLYASTWLDMERVWRSSATYNHCYLILPISLYFFWQKRHQRPRLSINPGWLWFPLLAIVLLQAIWLFGYAADLALLMHGAAVLSLQAVIWLLLGNQRSYQHRFALAYLIFLLPFGEELSPFLQNITADLTVMMLHLVNIPVYREGLYLATPVGLFEVAEACSGLRFLIAALAISVLFAHLHYRKWYKQLLFVGFMAVLSVLANGVRAFMLVFIGEKSNMQLGFGADHYLYGWLFFGLVLLAGFWLGARFADPLSTPSAAEKPLPTTQTTSLQLSFPLIAAIGILALTLSFRASLHVSAAPLQAVQLNLPFAASNAATSDWGIHFNNSQSYISAQDEHNIDYYYAQYANKQTQGELINWSNQLFNKQIWQIKQRAHYGDYTVLELRNLTGEYRTVVYWYQVGQRRTASELTTKLYQASTYLADDSSTAAVIATSSQGKMTEPTVSALLSAAGRLTEFTRSNAQHQSANDD